MQTPKKTKKRHKKNLKNEPKKSVDTET